MPQNRPCTVAWCDHDCRWEYETDGLPPVLSGADLLARARYLAGFGHPPFRWHSRLWPSGLCLEQNEFLPDADPRYVAEHGRLTISGATHPAQLAPGAGETQPGPHRPDGRVEAQLAADLAEAAALTTVAPGHIEPEPPPGAPQDPRPFRADPKPVFGVPFGLLSAGGPSNGPLPLVTGATPALTDAA